MTVQTVQNRTAQTASEDLPLPAGTIVGGKYKLVKPLGRGAFAWVYLAIHSEIPSLRLAVKVLHNQVAFDTEVRERFRAEAVLAAQLQSPNVVRITDYGAPAGQPPFIVMEYVEGETLSQRIERNGPIEEQDVARIGADIAAALKEAHSHGIVHRDLKPSNIYLVNAPSGPGFTAKVLDFGIAKVLTGLSAAEMVAFETASLSIHCTPRYASPELLRGQPSAQSDIYALGITMLEALNGMPPYTSSNTFEIAAQHLSTSPVPLGQAEAPTIRPVLRRACAKDPEERYLSATQMLEDLLRRFDPSVKARFSAQTDDYGSIREPTADGPSIIPLATQMGQGSGAPPAPVPSTPPRGFETSSYVPDSEQREREKSHITTLMPRFDERAAPAPRRALALVGVALLLTAVAVALLLSRRADPTEPTAVSPPSAEFVSPDATTIETDRDEHAAAVPDPPAAEEIGRAGSQAAETIGEAVVAAERARDAELAAVEAAAQDELEARAEDARPRRDGRSRDRAEVERNDERSDDRDREPTEPRSQEATPEPEPRLPVPAALPAEPQQAEPEPQPEDENPFGGLNTIGR